MIKNILWSALNTFSLSLNSIIPIFIISRYIEPEAFIDLNILYTFSTLGNIFIDYGQSQKCLLKKNIKVKTFEILESFMLSRTLISFCILLLFAIKQSYFSEYNWLVVLLILNSNIMSFINFRPRFLFNKLKLFKLRAKYGLISSLITSPISCLIAAYLNPNLGYILLLVLNPIIIGLELVDFN